MKAFASPFVWPVLARSASAVVAPNAIETLLMLALVIQKEEGGSPSRLTAIENFLSPWESLSARERVQRILCLLCAKDNHIIDLNEYPGETGSERCRVLKFA
jgi:hypothetical protein